MFKVLHIPDMTPLGEAPEWLVRAREMGFDGIEIVVGDRCTCELSATQESCIALGQEATRRGVRVVSLCLAADAGPDIGTGDEDRRLQGRERVRAAVRIGGWLGAQVLRIIPASSADRVRCSYQQTLNQTYRSLLNLRGDLERGGVVGAIEPCHHRFLLSPPELRELLDRVNSPWVAAALNWSACEAQGDPHDWAETLRYRLGAVIVEPAAEEAAVKALEDSGFEGAVIIAPRS